MRSSTGAKVIGATVSNNMVSYCKYKKALQFLSTPAVTKKKSYIS
jgi:hypothetical protein